MIKPFLPLGLVILALPAAAFAADDDLLTGDAKLACEATLCLSTGDRPGECAPSIKKYFSISAKKMSDTIKKRKNFLSLCPASKEEGMPALINALANGAGRCDAAELNRMGRKTYQVQQCTGKGKNKTCTTVT
ncbi:TrbM/KikA/MpfK family conjugal transfer protein, partial [Snodgrassella sp. CFCC 13594]|uniref:TrbM/KikA/MpfK family conjugal transfer protein n=1 Tax=Snodgrassella sp. CFCC 13594 TaxID=1775559 RepID=UPI0012E932C0